MSCTFYQHMKVDFEAGVFKSLRILGRMFIKYLLEDGGLLYVFVP